MNSWCFGHFLRDVFDHAYHAVLYTLYAWSSRITLISHVIMRTNFNQITKQMRDWVQIFISNKIIDRLHASSKKPPDCGIFARFSFPSKHPPHHGVSSQMQGRFLQFFTTMHQTKWQICSQLSGRQTQSIKFSSDVLLFINKRSRNMKKNVSTWRFQGHHASSFKQYELSNKSKSIEVEPSEMDKGGQKRTEREKNGMKNASSHLCYLQVKYLQTPRDRVILRL